MWRQVVVEEGSDEFRRQRPMAGGGAEGDGRRGPDRHMAAPARVLFLCSESIARGGVAQRLMGGDAWPFQVCPIETRQDWRRSRFADQVDDIDPHLDQYAIAVGHGYDAWVLMAAAEQRAVRGAAVPFLLLLNPVLGASQHLNGSLVGYRAPRGRRVRAAFGLGSADTASDFLLERASYVFGDNDRHSSQRDWASLQTLGCRVHVVRGWHRRNGEEVERQLREILIAYAGDVGTEVWRQMSMRAPPSVESIFEQDERELLCVGGG